MSTDYRDDPSASRPNDLKLLTDQELLQLSGLYPRWRLSTGVLCFLQRPIPTIPEQRLLCLCGPKAAQGQREALINPRQKMILTFRAQQQRTSGSLYKTPYS